MRYKHYLTENQYWTIWTDWVNEVTSDANSNCYEAILVRKSIWKNNFKHKYKLSYNELPAQVDHYGLIIDNDNDFDGYWGILTGSKKSINWFLLNI